MNISNYIRSIDNFPSKGITFRDITPIFQDPNIFNFVIEEMRKYIDKVKPDYLNNFMYKITGNIKYKIRK